MSLESNKDLERIDCVHATPITERGYIYCLIGQYGGFPAPSICQNICRKKIQWAEKEKILKIIPNSTRDVGVGVKGFYEHYLQFLDGTP
jgi:hypothetical protein